MADILAKNLYRYSYDDNTVYTTTADGVIQPSLLYPIQHSSNRFLTSTTQPQPALVIIEWDGKSATANLTETVQTFPNGQLLNYGYVGPNGDLFIGTFTAELCHSSAIMPFYRYSADDGLEVITSNLVSTSGVYLMERTQTLYLVDGCQKKLYAFDWSRATGKIGKGERERGARRRSNGGEMKRGRERKEGRKKNNGRFSSNFSHFPYS